MAGLNLNIAKSEKGESTIILAILITMGMGTAVYFTADKMNKDIAISPFGMTLSRPTMIKSG